MTNETREVEIKSHSPPEIAHNDNNEVEHDWWKVG